MIKLLPHGCYDLVDRVAQLIETDVMAEVGGTKSGLSPAAVKDELRRLHTDVVRLIGLIYLSCCRSLRTSMRRFQIWIGHGVIRGCVQMRKYRREHFDDEPFRPFDLLLCPKNIRVPLQGGQDRFIKGEGARGSRRCVSGFRACQQRRRD